MKINTNRYIPYVSLLILLCLGSYSCSSDDDAGSTQEPEVVYSAGEADFSTYVAIGNSLTSGYTDGALFAASQQNSLPNILANQFSLVGGGTFTQPLMADNIGGLTLGGTQIQDTRLYFNGAGPVRLPATPTTEVSTALSGTYNNLGVPGALSYHLMAPGYGNIAGVPTGQANPYFARFASSPSTSIIADALAQQPTFFTLWIGNNDVLGFATSGGVGVDQTGNFDPSSYASTDITDPRVFEITYSHIVNNLSNNNAKGVVANIPDITAVPFFTTVPFNPLSPANPEFGAQIPMLNSIFGALNQIFVALQMPERVIEFSEDAPSAVVIKDEYLTDISLQIEGALNANPGFPTFIAQFGLPAQAAPMVANLLGSMYGQSRQATQEDLLVLPSSNAIGTVNMTAMQSLISMGLSQALAGQFSVEGITLPMEDKWVLVPQEQTAVRNATQAYNTAIAAVAEAKGLAFVDANAILKAVAETGVAFDAFTLKGDLVFGGAFSLDGVHPTARGYAFLANAFLEAIEETYNASLPRVKAADYNIMYPAQLP
jgi:lysophospholipase L1-like esterase